MNKSQDVGNMNKTVPDFIKKKKDYLQRYNQELIDIQKYQELKNQELIKNQLKIKN